MNLPATIPIFAPSDRHFLSFFLHFTFLLLKLKEKIMILTDRAKELFEDYFIEEYNNNQDSYLNLGYGKSIVEGFYSIPFSMQFGAYLDWLDTRDIKIEIRTTDRETYTYKFDGFLTAQSFVTREEARKNALLKANKFLNEMAEIAGS